MIEGALYTPCSKDRQRSIARAPCPRVLHRQPSTAAQCKGGGLAQVAEQMVGLLSESRRAQLRDNVQHVSFAVGTMCSGTDVCVEVLASAVQAGGGIGISHMFSCEISPPKQQWILTMSQPGPPKYLFENVLDFAASQGRGNVGAFCMRSQRRHSAPATDIVYMGFSCKDVSRLNVNRIASGGCIRDRSLRTGSTLDGGMCYVVARRPRLVLLENVASLDDASKSSGLSNADDLFAHFSKIGYYLVSAIYDARKHGAVQRRTRWWGIAMRISDSALDDGDSERCKLWAEEILKTLSEVELEPANFENILMPENSEDLSEWSKAGVAAPEDHARVFGFARQGRAGPRGNQTIQPYTCTKRNRTRAGLTLAILPGGRFDWRGQVAQGRLLNTEKVAPGIGQLRSSRSS